jgi:hypothetical protein
VNDIFVRKAGVVLAKRPLKVVPGFFFEGLFRKSVPKPLALDLGEHLNPGGLSDLVAHRKHHRERAVEVHVDEA